MKKGVRLLLWACIVGYMLFIMHQTVFSRTATMEYKYDYHPFWSHAAIMNGTTFLIGEHILNVLVFMPLGALLWLVMERRQWWKAEMLGCVFSVCIEAMQLLMKRGFCEFDDVMHNTLGCVIGYGLIKLVAALTSSTSDATR